MKPIIGFYIKYSNYAFNLPNSYNNPDNYLENEYN